MELVKRSQRSPIRFATVVNALALSVVVSGCDVQGTSTDEVRTDVLYGKTLFVDNCAACHGNDAKGAGPASLGLGVVPPDLTILSRRNGGAFPRDWTMTVIHGYYRQEHLDNPMPIFSDGDLGELVQIEENGLSFPVPADLLALASYLESLQVE